jgi:hypothetical protein
MAANFSATAQCGLTIHFQVTVQSVLMTTDTAAGSQSSLMSLDFMNTVESLFMTEGLFQSSEICLF